MIDELYDQGVNIIVSAEGLIHELFENQVMKTPDNIALVFENEEMSYNQLNMRSNQVGYLIMKTISENKSEQQCRRCLNFLTSPVPFPALAKPFLYHPILTGIINAQVWPAHILNLWP